jgi:Zn-dependent protease
MPLGGLTTYEYTSISSTQQIDISIAGPAMSILLAAACLSVAVTASGAVGQFAMQLALFNVAIAALNSLPAFPLDGGRIARALAELRGHAPDSANRLVGRLGSACGLSLGVLSGAVAIAAPYPTFLTAAVVAALAVTGWGLVKSASATR